MVVVLSFHAKPRRQRLQGAAGWPGDVAIWPPPSPGHLICSLGVSDSCVASTPARARPVSLVEAGRPPSGSPRPSIAPTLRVDACDLPGKWIADLDVSLH